MTPLATPVIVARTNRTALRTRQLIIVLAGHLNVNLSRLMRKCYFGELPRSMDVQETAYVFL